MNLKELRNRLCQLSDPDFKKFVSDFGGDFQDREEVVSYFVGNPEHERRLCQLLDILTEEEKIAHGAMASASSARLSAFIAAIVAMIALISLLVTIYGVLK